MCSLNVCIQKTYMKYSSLKVFCSCVKTITIAIIFTKLAPTFYLSKWTYTEIILKNIPFFDKKNFVVET